MFYILFSAILILPVLMGFGSLFERLMGKPSTAIAGKILLGTVGVTLLWTILCFFIPLNIILETITVCIGLASFFYFRNNEILVNFLVSNIKTFLPILLAITFIGSYYPFILDHFGYYVPTIKWLSEFGFVKGIVNLDYILAQMSFWHVLQAGFSNFSDPFLRLNTLVVIAYLIYIFENKYWFHLVTIPLLCLFSQSPSPDLPVIVFSLIILAEILNGNRNTSITFMISVFIFAIKPTMIWLPLFVALYSVFIIKSKYTFALAGVLVLILFFIKSIYTYGFPMYPVQVVDFNVPWKPYSEILNNSARVAIQKTYDMQYTLGQIKKFSWYEYITNWLFLEGIKGKINQIFLLSLVIFGFYTFFKKEKILYFLFLSLVTKSFLVLIFSAQYRFYLDVFFAIAVVLFYKDFKKKTAVASFFFFSILVVIFLTFPNIVRAHLPSFRLGNYMMGFQTSQLNKPSHFKLKQYRTFEIGNLKFNVAKGYPFSFDTPLPAVSPTFLIEYSKAGIFPQKEGGGFIWKKLNAAQQHKLDKILSEYRADFQK